MTFGQVGGNSLAGQRVLSMLGSASLCALNQTTATINSSAFIRPVAVSLLALAPNLFRSSSQAAGFSSSTAAAYSSKIAAVRQLSGHTSVSKTSAPFPLSRPETSKFTQMWTARQFASSAEPQLSDEAQQRQKAEAKSQEEKGLPHVLETGGEGQIMPTPSMTMNWGKDSYLLMHPVYDPRYLETVKPTHKPPVKVHEKVGYNTIQFLRRFFDLATGYGPGMTERQWLRRMLFLETVAGVPGMVAGMLRHMRSLRTMQRDHGWIHTLLEEAENERMHLLTFLKLRQPGIMFRASVLVAQGAFFNAYLLAYMLWPKACHSFIGYLEEEAVNTYTKCIQEIDSGEGPLASWATTPAPDIALKYWQIPEGSTLRDLILNVRADEAAHAHVNHTFAHLDKFAENPFAPGSVHVP